jgi:hypothetical protein
VVELSPAVEVTAWWLAWLVLAELGVLSMLLPIVWTPRRDE